jgi:hypothetical protein
LTLQRSSACTMRHRSMPSSIATRPHNATLGAGFKLCRHNHTAHRQQPACLQLDSAAVQLTVPRPVADPRRAADTCTPMPFSNSDMSVSDDSVCTSCRRCCCWHHLQVLFLLEPHPASGSKGHSSQPCRNQVLQRVSAPGQQCSVAASQPADASSRAAGAAAAGGGDIVPDCSLLPHPRTACAAVSVVEQWPMSCSNSSIAGNCAPLITKHGS